MNTGNDTQTSEAPATWRDGNVDIDAIRETVESGEVTKHTAEDQLIELCDEVERVRQMHAKLRALYDRNVGNLVDQLDKAHKQLDKATKKATNSPETVLVREVLEALNLPWAANFDDRGARLELLEGRVAYVRGYVNSALDHGETAQGLADAVSESMPVTYVAQGGESR